MSEVSPIQDRAVGSSLDHLIPAEITHDRFHRAIVEIAATPGVREILEIGSSSGSGSTEAWVKGALRNPQTPRIHCIEVSRTRFAALAERWRDAPFVRCYNCSSVRVDRLASVADVERFHREERSRLRRVPIETLRSWLETDVTYLHENGLSADGIKDIQRRHGLERFDAVLIDGSEFGGEAELDDVYGARYILLDDTHTFKNWANVRRLAADPSYRLIRKGRWTRNGFAVFERIGG